MNHLLRNGILAATLTASALVSASPASAHGYYGHHGDNDAAIAIGAGVIGLAIGAAIASDHDDDRGYYRHDTYVSYPRYRREYYYETYPAYPVYRGYDDRYREHDRGWHRGWDHGGGWRRHERWEHDDD